MKPAARSPYLTVAEVAAAEGCSEWAVAHALRAGKIIPSSKIGSAWAIQRNYIWIRSMPAIIQPGHRRKRVKVVEPPGKPGRPPGSKNRYPYPVGVKRPRKARTNQ